MIKVLYSWLIIVVMHKTTCAIHILKDFSVKFQDLLFQFNQKNIDLIINPRKEYIRGKMKSKYYLGYYVSGFVSSWYFPSVSRISVYNILEALGMKCMPSGERGSLSPSCSL